MKATITNLGTIAVPLTSTQGKGLAISLEPGVAFTVDDPGVTVAIVGDNPSLMEDIKEGLETLRELAIKLVTFWRAHPKPHGQNAHPEVSIRVVAQDAIRVTGDDKNLDHEMIVGETYDVRMNDYVELRQLGVGGAATQPEAP